MVERQPHTTRPTDLELCPGQEPNSRPDLRELTDQRELDAQRMQIALEQARVAALPPRRDIPVGAAVFAPNGALLAAAGNRREADQDPTAHAEILALREAARVTGRWNLSGCTLVVTLEPCTMCAGAIVLSRVERVVVGALDPKAGAAGSLYNLVREPRLNHRVQLTTGVLAEECGQLLKDFFRNLRRVRAAQRTSPQPSRGEAESTRAECDEA